ncbi:MAG: nucleotide sugar dehydrogenase [Burkholderiales bacterium]
MKISIFGLGYVGAVSLACLARDGHTVIGVDIDTAKLELIRAGRTPVVEEGMIDLMTHVAASGRVEVTDQVREAVHRTDLSLICVGTPSAANGSQDQAAVMRLTHQLGQALRDKPAGHVLVFRSTLVPGTVEDVLLPLIERESGLTEGKDFHVCFQPEFLREGSSIKDYDRPPFTVVGARSPVAEQALRNLFGHLDCEFISTSVRSAEMMKYCCNNFHALKITFANETARLCEALGVNPFEVMDLVCQDTQLNISRAYLRPGYAFGGSCLPKDLRATHHMARTRDVELPMLGAILASNRLHVERAFDKVVATGARRIALLGLSFKPGTDDLRESPLVMLAELLYGKGYQLSIVDPDVQLSRLLGANRRYIETHLPHLGDLLTPDLETAIRDAQTLVIGNSSDAVLTGLSSHARADQQIVDLVGVASRLKTHARIHGLAWTPVA